jgi:hypothetical protein
MTLVDDECSESGSYESDYDYNCEPHAQHESQQYYPHDDVRHLMDAYLGTPQDNAQPSQGYDLSPTQVDILADNIEEEEEVPYEAPPGDEGRGVRRMCFTLNNYTDAELALMKPWLDSLEYHVVSKEVGKNGTPHLQGYFRMKNCATSTAIHKKPGMARASIFYCKGDEQQNDKYCRKGGPQALWSTKGTMQPGQGARSDLKKASEKIRDGGIKAMKTLARDEPWMIVRYGKGFEKLCEYIDEERNLDKAPEVIYLYGATGSGKSLFESH